VIKKKVISVKESLSDNDFIILVSEFYESLKPLQRKAFERERSGMNPEQFRLYMTPILKRKNINSKNESNKNAAPKQKKKKSKKKKK